jgi:hypothetical protein
MIRYTLDDEIRKLWNGEHGEALRYTPLPAVNHHKNEHRFIDILGYHSKTDRLLRVKVHFPNGDIFEGCVSLDFVSLHHVDELFDGRFNSDQAIVSP